jgi:hypothetical protein
VTSNVIASSQIPVFPKFGSGIVAVEELDGGDATPTVAAASGRSENENRKGEEL